MEHFALLVLVLHVWFSSQAMGAHHFPGR